MPIAAIYIDGKFSNTQGMMNVNDFLVSNWFRNFPDTDGVPFAGYYFGNTVLDITRNSFDNSIPLKINGEISNRNGYVTLNTENYFDTSITAPVSITLAGVARRREVTEGTNQYMIADFSGAAGQGLGLAVGFSVTGGLIVAGQNPGQSVSAVATVNFPESIEVGDWFSYTAFIRQGTITVAIYNPATQKYISAAQVLPGTRVAGTQNIFLGRKPDNNNNNASFDIKSVVMISGSISEAQHIAVMQYLLAMT